ncbi:MAG: hypothetical protein R2695_13590 [Acidimicrobiales bacterium]
MTDPVDDVGADFVVYIHDNAVLPAGFLAELIAAQVALDAPRVQPAHRSGPAAGPPICEVQHGVVAREVDAVTPLPVLSIRTGRASTVRWCCATPSRSDSGPPSMPTMPATRSPVSAGSG